MSHGENGGGDPSGTAFLEPSIVSLTRLGYKRISDLGKGSFGSVVLCEDQTREQWAMKIVVPDQVSFGELRIWRTLQHPNVLPLNLIISLPEVPAIVFKMPVLKRSLEQIIQCPKFRNSQSALDFTIKFCKEIADGLAYLHHRNLVHMDLKTNNVLVSLDRRAVICDFTFLNTATDPVKDYGTPLHLRPPEACPSKRFSVPVHGPSYETWTFGLLALDAFTKHLTWHLPQPKNWAQDIYPVLHQFLQGDYFYSRVRYAFPARDLQDEEIATIRNFIIMFLALRPEDRPSMVQAVSHRLFKSDGIWASEDHLWKAVAVEACQLTAEEPTKPPIDNCTYVVRRQNPANINGTYVANGPDPGSNKRTNDRVSRASKSTRASVKQEEPRLIGTFADFDQEFNDKEPLLGKKKGRFRGALKWIRKKIQKLKIT